MATLISALKVGTASTVATTAAEVTLSRQQNQVRVCASTDLYVRPFTASTAAAALVLAAAASTATSNLIATAQGQEYFFIPAGQTKIIWRSPQPQYVALSVISAAIAVTTVEATDFFTN
jgi:hypothetical protein